jgi:hypothetical protein
MSSTAPEYLWLVEESAYGTPVVSPVVGTSQFLVPLLDSNSFSMVEDPVFQEIPYGGGLDVVADVVADHREVKGTLNTLGYPALFAFLMNAAVTRVNAAQTAPWVTTEPPLDLVSFYAYHLIRTRTGTWLTYGYPGCKVISLQGSVSRQDPKLKLSLQLQAQKELPNASDSSAAPTPPAAPTEAQYPRGPYLFSHTGGNITWNSGTLAQYSELSFSINNKTDPQWFEGNWLYSNGCKGREATADMSLLLKATPGLRANYQSLTAGGFSLEFNNGTHTATVNFNGNNHINKLPFDLPLGKEFMQKAAWRNKWDPTALSGAGADITFTST